MPRCRPCGPTPKSVVQRAQFGKGAAALAGEDTFLEQAKPVIHIPVGLAEGVVVHGRMRISSVFL